MGLGPTIFHLSILTGQWGGLEFFLCISVLFAINILFVRFSCIVYVMISSRWNWRPLNLEIYPNVTLWTCLQISSQCPCFLSHPKVSTQFRCLLRWHEWYRYFHLGGQVFTYELLMNSLFCIIISLPLFKWFFRCGIWEGMFYGLTFLPENADKKKKKKKPCPRIVLLLHDIASCW